MTPKSRNSKVGARRPLPANGWVNAFPSTTRIGVQCHATVLALWFTARSVILTVESWYPRQRNVQSTATVGCDMINCWERCCIFGRLNGYVQRWTPCGGGIEYFHRDPTSRRRRRKGKSQIWDSKIWSRVPRDSDQREIALARASSIYKRQTRHLVREGAPQEQDRICHTSNKDLDVSPKWVLYTKTDWPADRRS
jgi:hypothetical protein